MAETAPYIGAHISLVSKSNIRYEGVLYTIDTKESSIALQNGTRRRRSLAALAQGDAPPCRVFAAPTRACV